ncbi:RagB/SusD family nutrient uptake outer membrane protein [Sphingobacterium hungaricum]
MKILNKIIYLGLAITLLNSCSKGYLDTAPTHATGPDVVFESVENAKLAINGLSRLMKRQYLGSQGFNGEGTIKLYYGEYAGENLSHPQATMTIPVNMEFFSNNQSTYGYFPWYYYYTIISNANAIIHQIDAVSGPQNEKEFIKAQALTFRAYSYMMLAQVYGDRWSSSNNGNTSAVVLRLEEGLNDLPLSTLADTYKVIYDDLDLALSLYTSSGLDRDTDRNYQVNKDVAHAIYARAALNKEDFANAEKYAKLARANYALMTNAEYKSGFSNPNREWIWSVYDNTDETIFFYAYGAYIGYNSTATVARTFPKSINKELYDKIPASDIRKSMFFNPVGSGFTFNASTGRGSDAALAEVRRLYTDIPSNSHAYSYMQFKIKANVMPGTANINNFRASEMLLIEAEAKYKQSGSATDIQNLLIELNRTSGRDAEYTCTLTGVNLFNEIKKYRGIELWGEGFDFFDRKRWGDSIVRKSHAAGGNFLQVFAITINPTDNNGWKVVTPARETDYNSLID